MRAYRDDGFPITIVRPSLTYGDTQIVLAVNSWQKSFTALDRMRRGKKVIVQATAPPFGSSPTQDFAQGFVGFSATARPSATPFTSPATKSSPGTSSTASPPRLRASSPTHPHRV